VPINTKIDGDPDSVRGAAAWLRSSLQASVRDCGSQLYRARTHAESGWQGEASSSFQGKMATAGQGVDVVDADTGGLAQSFDHYADSLYTAQVGMARAKDIAVGAGLAVHGDVIEDPGPASTTTQAQAYEQAKQEADRANGIVDGAKRFAQDFWQEIENKKYIHATDFTNDLAGDLIKAHTSILKKEAQRLTNESKVAEARYLSSPGGSPEAKFQEEVRLSKVMGASELDEEAVNIGRRFASKIPVVGWAIAGVGIGWDIHDGKPPGKAIFSGVAGTLGAAAVIAVVPGIGWAAAAGLVSGVVIGMGADWAYDHLVPDGVKQKIDDGLTAVGHGFESAGKAVGHFFGSIF
jgi:hypothetical protein